MSLFHVEEDENGERKVLAHVRIEPGAVICKFAGKIIDYEKTLTLGNKESFAFQVEKDIYIYLDQPYRYFNHCCEPNCGVTPNQELIALKTIDKNEELRYDYSTTMLEHHWKMKCTCHKPSCRKIVTDFVKLPKLLQKKYLKLNIVQEFIVKHLNKKTGVGHSPASGY